jgi:NADH-quinone oxidoreductase subunit G
MARAAAAIQDSTRQHGPQSVAVAASARCSLETLAVIQAACRQNGWMASAGAATERQAAALRTAVARLEPDLAVSLADIAGAADVLVIGADPLSEAPMLALSLRQVVRGGGRVTVLDPRGVRLPFEFEHWAVHPHAAQDVLRALDRQLQSHDAPGHAAGIAFPTADLARRLNASPRPMVVCGTDTLASGDVALAADIARSLHATHKTVGLFYLMQGPNAFAAALGDGAAVSAARLVEAIEAGTVRSLIAVESDLWQTFPDRKRLTGALARLDHLVWLDYLDTDPVRTASVFIPSMPLYECGGHWINQEGRLQAAAPVLAGGDPITVTGGGDHPPRIFEDRIPGGIPLPAWQALAALSAAEDVRQDAEAVLRSALARFHPAVGLPLDEAAGRRIDLAASMAADPTPPTADTAPGPSSEAAILLLMVERTFGTEPLSALAPALMAREDAPLARVHPETLAALDAAGGETVVITVNGESLTLAVTADATMAPGVFEIPRHHRLAWQVAGETRVWVTASDIETLTSVGKNEP